MVEALNMGADVAMILGCRLDECHYLDGNYKALARSEMIIELLDDLGYERERFSLHRLSSAEPDVFVAAVTFAKECFHQIEPRTMFRRVDVDKTVGFCF